MSEKKLDCGIVRDLLPLYHDGVVSDVTKAAVEDHLSECVDCGMEFLKLRAQLPEEKEVTPKKKFADILRTRKKYRILASVTALALVCGLLIGGYFLQLQFPVVPVRDGITVERIYRYETEEQYKYFMILSHPMYDCMLIRPEGQNIEWDGQEMNLLEIACYRPLISRNHGNRSRIMVVDGGFESIDGRMVKTEYDIILIGGEPVWCEEDVPEYVYEYERHEIHGGSCTLDMENNLIGFNCEDGEFRYWDLDGNLLDGISDEK